MCHNTLTREDTESLKMRAIQTIETSVNIYPIHSASYPRRAEVPASSILGQIPYAQLNADSADYFS